MPDLKNIFTITITLIYLLTINSYAQEWSEPVVITSMPLYSTYPDFTIDKTGVIHCVWTTKLDDNFYKIYYSKSMDDGISWSEPFDVSMNDEKWVSSPHIVVDTNNVLHVTYDYDVGNTSVGTIYHKSFENGTWSESYNVTNSMQKAHHNRLAIDNNNRLYCFWFTPLYNGTTFYRYREPGNPAWYDFYTPYYNYDTYFFEKVVIDPHNEIHCVGAHHFEGQSVLNDKVFYTKFNNNIWDTAIIISDSITGSGLDLALDSNNLPHAVWRHKPPNSGYELDSTAYRYYDGNNWSKEVLFAGSDETRYQQIVCDSENNFHIVNVEKYDDLYILMYYYIYEENWMGNIIFEHDATINHNKLIYYNNYLYLVYARIDNVYDSYDESIVFQKTGLSIKVKEHLNLSNKVEIYPNPFVKNTSIKIRLNHDANVKVSVYNLNGKTVKIFFNGKLLNGTHSFNWDGTGNYLEKLKPGIYILRIASGKEAITRKIEIIK